MDSLRDDYTSCPYCGKSIYKDHEGLTKHAVNCTTRIQTGESTESFLEDLLRSIKEEH